MVAFSKLVYNLSFPFIKCFEKIIKNTNTVVRYFHKVVTIVTLVSTFALAFPKLPGLGNAWLMVGGTSSSFASLHVETILPEYGNANLIVYHHPL